MNETRCGAACLQAVSCDDSDNTACKQAVPHRILFFVVCILTAAIVTVSQEPAPKTESATEKRFPPLHVPQGFEARLFACDPLVEYPSVIALGPRPGTLFVANDYVKGQGTEITRRDDIRLAEDTNGDGYADRAPVFAAGFGSIQGLEWYDDTLFVMHAPRLTALRDTNGDGKADERRDLLTGLGLPPEKNPSRLHCANGIVAGHDGWLYLAMGDNGSNVPRPEGDRLVFNGGGILRCRPDGRGLHVFATGMRNIYDVALDDELNVFVRDNENDGGDFMVRVCHSFFGADHGYPYLYRDRPAEGLRPIADLGRGSSAGGVCYRETQFPAELRGQLFFCEWGRAVVRYPRKPAGSGFADVREHDFAFGDAEDPYGFKPTDIVVLRDGSMMISDWADGQSTRRGRARIYHVRYVGAKEKKDGSAKRASTLDEAIALLNSPSYLRRLAAQMRVEKAVPKGLKALGVAIRREQLNRQARLHAVWIIAHFPKPDAAVDELFDVLARDPEPSVRLQAVRAIADLTDPVLVQGKLAAGGGEVSTNVARRLAAAFDGQSPAVQREMVIALGRLRWKESPVWLAEKLKQPNAAMAHAAMQTLRQSENWSAVLGLLDRPTDDTTRTISLRALAERWEAAVVDGLMARLEKEKEATRQQQYADLLTRVWKKPGPWTYWGYRPAPRPANPTTWDRTAKIQAAIDRFLLQGEEPARVFVLGRMRREAIPTPLETLRRWLGETKSPEAVSALLVALAQHPSAATREDLIGVATSRQRTVKNRAAAVSMLIGRLAKADHPRLAKLAEKLEDGPVLAAVIQSLGDKRVREATPQLLKKLESTVPAVRAASIEALAKLGADEAKPLIAGLVEDADAKVRVAAVSAVGTLKIRSASPALRQLAASSQGELRDACFRSLRQLGDAAALPSAVKALKEGGGGLPALEFLAALGNQQHAEPIADLALRSPSLPVLTATVDALSRWADDEKTPQPRRVVLIRLASRIQGQHGVLLRWQVRGPLSDEEADKQLKQMTKKPVTDDAWKSMQASETSQLTLGGGKEKLPAHWLTLTRVGVDQPTTAAFQISSRDEIAVWVNGRKIHTQPASGASTKFGAFEAKLPKGINDILVQAVNRRPPARFQLTFRHKSDSAQHERLTLLAMKQKGDAVNGRKLFFNEKKTQCIKCHRLGEQGERIGPELTGIGRRFSRTHLIESLLRPSRSIAPSYRTLSVVLADGRPLAGVVVAQDEKTVTLADNKGKKHRIARGEIEQQAFANISTMPEGLEKPLTPAEFVDLIAFLVGQRDR